MKPPSIIMLTPSGRFSIGNRICLNISDFHPETWTSNMGIRGIIISLISFMCEETITTGAVQASSFIRKKMAKESWGYNLKDKHFCELFPEYIEECKSKSEIVETESNTIDKLTMFYINHQKIITLIFPIIILIISSLIMNYK